MGRFYTGVGSRETPKEVLEVMQSVASILALDGWILRSGGAGGADNAFEVGADKVGGLKEIYLPWEGFSDLRSDNDSFFTTGGDEGSSLIASKIHPAWGRLSQGAKRLHSRNANQVLGRDLKTPSRYVLCYAPLDKKGEPKGGTRSSIKIAEEWGIPVFNLVKSEDITRIRKWLDTKSI